jgi:hypothetical protein
MLKQRSGGCLDEHVFRLALQVVKRMMLRSAWCSVLDVDAALQHRMRSLSRAPVLPQLLQWLQHTTRALDCPRMSSIANSESAQRDPRPRHRPSHAVSSAVKTPPASPKSE